MCHWWFEARYQQEVLKFRTQACGLGWRRPRRVVWTASPHNPTLDTEGCQTLGLPRETLGLGFHGSLIREGAPR
jgi:hypothetical protein